MNKCVDCDKELLEFELRCKPCEKIYLKAVATRAEIRMNFKELMQNNQYAAMAIYSDMLDDEGPEFTNELLGDLIKPLIDRKVWEVNHDE